MTALEGARAALAAWDRDEDVAIDAILADAIRDLITEHERLTAEWEADAEAVASNHRAIWKERAERAEAEVARLTAPPTDDWEYGVKREYIDGWETGHRLDDRHYVDTRYVANGEQTPNLMRRRKAGPWEVAP